MGIEPTLAEVKGARSDKCATEAPTKLCHLASAPTKLQPSSVIYRYLVTCSVIYRNLVSSTIIYSYLPSSSVTYHNLVSSTVIYRYKFEIINKYILFTFFEFQVTVFPCKFCKCKIIADVRHISKKLS